MKTLIPILFLNLFFLCVSSAGGSDLDEDGYSDEIEFQWGSDPQNPTSVPFFSYTVNDPYYPVGVAITANRPLVPAGTTGFSVSPPLPAGLVMNPSTGIITGTPTTASPSEGRVVTASHPDVSRLVISLYIEVFAVPDIAVNTAPQITDFTSLGEFTINGNPESWTGRNAGLVTSGGLLTVNTNGASPGVSFVQGSDLTSGGQKNVLEFRIRQPVAAQPVSVRWIDDQGSFPPNRAVVIDGVLLRTDGAFHVYQIDLSTLFRGPVRGLSLDFGVPSGNTLQIDYVRLGKPALSVAGDLQITEVRHDKGQNRLEFSCPSIPGQRFRLEGSTNLTSWSGIGGNIAAVGGSTTTFRVDGISTSVQRYFRVVRLAAP